MIGVVYCGVRCKAAHTDNSSMNRKNRQRALEHTSQGHQRKGCIERMARIGNAASQEWNQRRRKPKQGRGKSPETKQTPVMSEDHRLKLMGKRQAPNLNSENRCKTKLSRPQ